MPATNPLEVNLRFQKNSPKANVIVSEIQPQKNQPMGWFFLRA